MVLRVRCVFFSSDLPLFGHRYRRRWCFFRSQHTNSLCIWALDARDWSVKRIGVCVCVSGSFQPKKSCEHAHRLTQRHGRFDMQKWLLCEREWDEQIQAIANAKAGPKFELCTVGARGSHHHSLWTFWNVQLTYSIALSENQLTKWTVSKTVFFFDFCFKQLKNQWIFKFLHFFFRFFVTFCVVAILDFALEITTCRI